MKSACFTCLIIILLWLVGTCLIIPLGIQSSLIGAPNHKSVFASLLSVIHVYFLHVDRVHFGHWQGVMLIAWNVSIVTSFYSVRVCANLSGINSIDLVPEEVLLVQWSGLVLRYARHRGLGRWLWHRLLHATYAHIGLRLQPQFAYFYTFFETYFGLEYVTLVFLRILQIKLMQLVPIYARLKTTRSAL